jgi:hypothetical protein
MAESRPLIGQAFHQDRVSQLGCCAQGLPSFERRLLGDRCNPPERKIKLRSGEDGEFSNN